MTKTPINLQDLRRRIYVKAKAEPFWCFSAEASAGSRGGRRWLYEELELFDEYKVKRYKPASKAAPA